MNRARNNGRQLTRNQKRILLWMPLLGFWAVLLLVSRSEESGRDWANILMMGFIGGLVYVGLWFALLRLTGSSEDSGRQDEAGPTRVSRASLIYGSAARRDAGEQQDDAQPPVDETAPPKQS